MNALSNNRMYSEDIRNEYADLAEGVSRRGICPLCAGGRSRETSFSVRRIDGALVFKCHRAGCGFSGSAADLGSARRQAEPVTPQGISGADRYASIGKSPLPKGVAAYLSIKYYLTDENIADGELRWTTQYSPEGEGRVVMPVWDIGGWLYGFTARSFTGINPKTLSFLENSRGAWYKSGKDTRKLLIVEDQLSAIRASEYIDSCALLGTNISDALNEAIFKEQYDEVFLALDKDAYGKALNLAIQHRRLRMKVPMLTRDLKDLDHKQLLDWLTVNCGVER